MRFKGKVSVFIFLFQLLIAAPNLLADSSSTNGTAGWVNGALSLKPVGMVHISEKPIQGELISIATIEIKFESKEGEIPLGTINLEMRMPVFGFKASATNQEEIERNELALSSARLGTLHDLVEFEERGMRLNALPDGVVIASYRPYSTLGPRGAQFMEKLSDANFKIIDGSLVSIFFDARGTLQKFKILPPLPEPTAVFIPETFALARDLMRADLDKTPLSEVEKTMNNFEKLISKEENTFYELSRTALAAEALMATLSQFHERKVYDYEVAKHEAEKEGKTYSPSNEWEDKTNLDRLELILARSKKIRDTSISRICQNRLMSLF